MGGGGGEGGRDSASVGDDTNSCEASDKSKHSDKFIFK